MLRPTAPPSMVTSVSTSGDSETTPLAVWCGSGIGTRTARTRSWRMTGFESDIVRAQYELPARAPKYCARFPFRNSAERAISSRPFMPSSIEIQPSNPAPARIRKIAS